MRIGKRSPKLRRGVAQESGRFGPAQLGFRPRTTRISASVGSRIRARRQHAPSAASQSAGGTDPRRTPSAARLHTATTLRDPPFRLRGPNLPPHPPPVEFPSSGAAKTPPIHNIVCSRLVLSCASSEKPLRPMGSPQPTGSLGPPQSLGSPPLITHRIAAACVIAAYHWASAMEPIKVAATQWIAASYGFGRPYKKRSAGTVLSEGSAEEVDSMQLQPERQSPSHVQSTHRRAKKPNTS